MKVGDVIIVKNPSLDEGRFWRFEIVSALNTEPKIFVAVKHVEIEAIFDEPLGQVAFFLEDGTSLGDMGWIATHRKSRARKIYS